MAERPGAPKRPGVGGTVGGREGERGRRLGNGGAEGKSWFSSQAGRWARAEGGEHGTPSKRQLSRQGVRGGKEGGLGPGRRAGGAGAAWSGA